METIGQRSTIPRGLGCDDEEAWPHISRDPARTTPVADLRSEFGSCQFYFVIFNFDSVLSYSIIVGMIMNTGFIVVSIVSISHLCFGLGVRTCSQDTAIC